MQFFISVPVFCLIIPNWCCDPQSVFVSRLYRRCSSGISVILRFLQDFVDELHEIPISVAIIVLVGVGAHLLRELCGVRDG